jgi:polygalacturonase
MKKLLYSIIIMLIPSLSEGKDVNILDFGANPDGKTLTTEAIQKAIDYCSETGGGTVTVPPGTYLSTSIFLRDNVNFHITKGATILGSTDPKAFKAGLVTADNVQNAAVTGLGTINGQGFKKDYPTDGPRHNNLLLFRSKNIRVKDITLINSSNWVSRIRECDGVIMQGVKVYSFSNENNDGIDIDGRNIILSDCIFDCDDDAICLKSTNPDFLVENVVITNCIVASNCNAIKLGQNLGGFRNVSVSNCVVRRPSEAAQRKWSSIQGVTSDTTVISGINLLSVDGGTLEQVTISNITMTGIQTPIFIRIGNRIKPGELKNVVICNITATDESMMTSSVTAVPGSYIENVIIRDIIFNCKGTGTLTEAQNTVVPEAEKAYNENRMFGYSLPAYGLYARRVKGLVVDNFIFNFRSSDARPAIVLDDCHNTRISNFDADPPAGNQPLIRIVNSGNITVSGYQSDRPAEKFIRIEGEKSYKIKLTGNDFTGVSIIKETAAGASASGILLSNNFGVPAVREKRNNNDIK